MKRREFLKNCSLVLTGLAVTKGVGMQRNWLFAKESGWDFSLDLLTDDPVRAVAKLTDLLRTFDCNLDEIKYTEYTLPGQQIGDLVLIKNEQLINFRKSPDALSKQLLEIANELGLPRAMENPTLVRFSNKRSERASTEVHIFHKNRLIEKISVAAHQPSLQIKGTKGELTVAIESAEVRITHASCKHKTCVKMGRIEQSGQNLVCVPNEIRIAIAGENALGVDSVAY
ncbi:MAG: NusG domain II-containing protein [bacterium]